MPRSEKNIVYGLQAQQAEKISTMLAQIDEEIENDLNHDFNNNQTDNQNTV